MAELTITALSQKYNLNSDTIRYYERIGLIPAVPRSTNGNRYYDEKMQDWIEMLLCLRHSGISVAVLQEYVRQLRLGDQTLASRQMLLENQLSILLEKQKSLQRSAEHLQHKISLYQTGEIKKHKNYFKEYGIAEENET